MMTKYLPLLMQHKRKKKKLKEPSLFGFREVYMEIFGLIFLYLLLLHHFLFAIIIFIIIVFLRLFFLLFLILSSCLSSPLSLSPSLNLSLTLPISRHPSLPYHCYIIPQYTFLTSFHLTPLSTHLAKSTCGDM